MKPHNENKEMEFKGRQEDTRDEIVPVSLGYFLRRKIGWGWVECWLKSSGGLLLSMFCYTFRQQHCINAWWLCHNDGLKWPLQDQFLFFSLFKDSSTTRENEEFFVEYILVFSEEELRYHPSHQNKSNFASFVSHFVSWCNVSHVAYQFRHKQFRTQIPCRLMRTFNFQGGVSISHNLVFMK